MAAAPATTKPEPADEPDVSAQWRLSVRATVPPYRAGRRPRAGIPQVQPLPLGQVRLDGL
jgi:hypothetical protein